MRMSEYIHNHITAIKQALPVKNWRILYVFLVFRVYYV